MAQNEPTHQDLLCLQIQLISSLLKIEQNFIRNRISVVPIKNLFILRILLYLVFFIFK